MQLQKAIDSNSNNDNNAMMIMSSSSMATSSSSGNSDKRNCFHRVRVLTLVVFSLFSAPTSWPRPRTANAFVQVQQNPQRHTAGGRNSRTNRKQHQRRRSYYCAPPTDNRNAAVASCEQQQSNSTMSRKSNGLLQRQLELGQDLVAELIATPPISIPGDYSSATMQSSVGSEECEESSPPAAVAVTNAALLQSSVESSIECGAIMDPLSSTTTSGVAAETTLNDDVNTILALSGKAAAKADGSIPPEALEQIETKFTSSSSSSSKASRNFATIAGTDTNQNTTVFTSDDSSGPLLSSLTTTAAITTIPKERIQIEQQLQEALLSSLTDIISASSVVGEPSLPLTTTTTTKIFPPKIDAPSVSKIFKFAIPAIGVWLCGPLLSLIDTSAVGIFSGTIQQAALNPAVAVTDYAALLIAFMYTGTTNMVAAAQESDHGTTDKPRTAKTMIGAMQMSTYVGAGLGAFLFVFARPLLNAIIGNDSISPAVFAAAMKYVRIRALGMPAAAIIGSTQAACLGMQDIQSPLYVLVAAAVVNFFGDILFVSSSNPWVGGAAGAALATIISQYAAVVFFTKWLTDKQAAEPRPAQVLNISSAILEMTNEKSTNDQNRQKKGKDAIERFTRRKLQKVDAKRTDDSFSARGFLKNRFTPADMMKFPSKEIRGEFKEYLVPVTTTQVGRVSGYVAMSHVIASSLGTASMAAQQVIVSLFYCLCPIADSLSLTAQSLIPRIAEKEASPEKAAALRESLFGFAKAGAIFGVGMMGAVSAIPLLSGLFTSDPAVIGLVNSVVPLLLVFFGTHGFVCASEGMLLGQKDLGFLGKMYAVFFAAVPFLMLRLKRAALTGGKVVNLASVWSIFVGYQVVRCAIWVARSLRLQRRNYLDGQRFGKNFESDHRLSP